MAGKPTGPYPACVTLGTITATTDDAGIVSGWTNNTGHTVKILSASLTGIWTAHASNYMTYTLKDGSGHTIVAKALTTPSCTGTADVSMGTISTTYYELDDGETCYILVAQTGNGLTATRLVLNLRYELVRT